jgi:hypothetical protein
MLVWSAALSDIANIYRIPSEMYQCLAEKRIIHGMFPNYAERKEEKNMSSKTAAIEGIRRVIDDKLRASGVAETTTLFATAATSMNWGSLAAKTDISAKLILKSASRADLMYVNGVGEEFAGPLETAVIDNVLELTKHKVQNLLEALKKSNVEKTPMR